MEVYELEFDDPAWIIEAIRSGDITELVRQLEEIETLEALEA